MIDFSNAQIEQLAIHGVGNKHRAEKNFISESLFTPPASLKEELITYFLKPFKKTDDIYRFQGENNLMEESTRAIFEDTEKLLPTSVDMLIHLYRQSNHPNIKTGEVCVVYFSNILLDDELIDGIGVFKSEQKHAFLKFVKEGEQMTLNMQTGISMEKLDKGALILNMENSNGYRILSVDNNNYNTNYWQFDFMGMDYVKDENFHTRSYLELVDEFSKEVVANNGDKQDQRKFLNDTVQYFSANDKFDFNDFTEKVVNKPEWIEEVKSFRDDYALNEVDTFNISANELKRVKKKLVNNTVQLDTDIQIRFGTNDPDGKSEFVEREFDEEKGMYYYKLYFNEEL